MHNKHQVPTENQRISWNGQLYRENANWHVRTLQCQQACNATRTQCLTQSFLLARHGHHVTSTRNSQGTSSPHFSFSQTTLESCGRFAGNFELLPEKKMRKMFCNVLSAPPVQILVTSFRKCNRLVEHHFLHFTQNKRQLTERPRDHFKFKFNNRGDKIINKY